MDKTLYYMQKAIEQAEIAAAENEVPVGAVIVRNDEIVATGRNRREQGKNALLHAETDAIYNACQKLGGWRLWNCEIYVTLEPCPMCAGAIINAHIPKVYFGAYDLKNRRLRYNYESVPNAVQFQARISRRYYAGGVF